jgi:hypothetical protein
MCIVNDMVCCCYSTRVALPFFFYALFFDVD